LIEVKESEGEYEHGCLGTV